MRKVIDGKRQEAEKILIVVKGGTVTGVFQDGNADICVVDFDNDFNPEIPDAFSRLPPN